MLGEIWLRLLIITLVSVTLVVVDQLSETCRFPVISITVHSLVGLALGLLLVFRTNSACAYLSTGIAVHLIFKVTQFQLLESRSVLF